MQSALDAGLHVACIMDGNGRWATARGLPRAAGHREGVLAVRRVVEAAPDLGIGTLTLYAFSADNWSRPEGEVAWLMRLLREYLRAETPRCVRDGVRLTVLGRRDRLAPKLVDTIARAQAATAAGCRLHLRVAVDYSGRDALLRAARAGAERGGAALASRDAFARLVAEVDHDATAAPPPVDLLIRTGGERRLSDFLLWECAYAELRFVPVMWPDVSAADLRDAIDDFRARERRFGGLPAARRRSASC